MAKGWASSYPDWRLHNDRITSWNQWLLWLTATAVRKCGMLSEPSKIISKKLRHSEMMRALCGHQQQHSKIIWTHFKGTNRSQFNDSKLKGPTRIQHKDRNSYRSQLKGTLRSGNELITLYQLQDGQGQPRYNLTSGAPSSHSEFEGNGARNAHAYREHTHIQFRLYVLH